MDSNPPSPSTADGGGPLGSTSSSSGGDVVVGLDVGDLDAFADLLAVGLADAVVGVAVGDGAWVVGAAVVGAAVVGAGDELTDLLALGVGLGEGSGASLLRDAHRAPAPSPSTIATTTAMMIGTLDCFSSGGGSGSPAGGIAMVG